MMLADTRVGTFSVPNDNHLVGTSLMISCLRRQPECPSTLPPRVQKRQGLIE